jgi:hypothetical protein
MFVAKVDIEDLICKLDKDIQHFQTRYQLDNRNMADILLSLGQEFYFKDICTRSLNGNSIPYLANWYLRQGVKYYHKNLGNNHD